MTEITIPLRSHEEAILVLGPYDRYAKLLRQDLEVDVFTRNGNLRLKGTDERVQEARRRIEHLLGKTRKGRDLGITDIESILLGNDSASARPVPPPARPGATRAATPYRLVRTSTAPPERTHSDEQTAASTRPRPVGSANLKSLRINPIEPRTENQRRYLDLIEKLPLVIGLGAAGSGKTYLAVAAAVKALRAGTCRRLVITRPVVEAGERLGFLPGDLAAKLDPYMRPIYDAFHDLIDFDDVARLEESGIIEIAPLAYMRGRTLSHAFAILDEGQNTSIAQMKMFLTRLGEGSRMVITGDPSQSDLEGSQRSGLLDALTRLRGFKDVGVVEFGARDIVRHPLVEQIIKAYEAPSRISREGDRGP